MRYFLIAAVITYFSFLFFPEAVFSQNEAECPAMIFFGDDGVKEFVWRDGTVDGSGVSYIEGNFWVGGKWVKTDGKFQWQKGDWKKIRNGWVYIHDGSKRSWVSCSELNQ